MKRLLPFVFILVGIGIFLIGFIYDVWFAGIPYQDPTPALAAQYAYHAQIASIIRWIGLGIGLFGGLVMIFQRGVDKVEHKRGFKDER